MLDKNEILNDDEKKRRWAQIWQDAEDSWALEIYEEHVLLQEIKDLPNQFEAFKVAKNRNAPVNSIRKRS